MENTPLSHNLFYNGVNYCSTNPTPWVTTTSVSLPTSQCYNIGVNEFISEDVKVTSGDVDMTNINIEKYETYISLEILANGLFDDDIDVYSSDDKMIVNFLEDDFAENDCEILKCGFLRPSGNIEFEFSKIYDIENLSCDLINGILYIGIPKFKKYLRRDFDINTY